jgi:galactonate dehydratase
VGGLLQMRKIATIADAHYVSVAPHNPMGPLATAVNLHFAAAQPQLQDPGVQGLADAVVSGSVPAV